MISTYYNRFLKPFTRNTHMGLKPMPYDSNENKQNQINKTSPKLVVEELAKVEFDDLGDLC